MDQENRYESNFQLCLRDVSQTEAWELTYIIIQLLKDKGNIHEIYQMLTDGTILNRRVHVDPGDALIDFALLESLTRQGSYPGKILQREGIRTDAPVVLRTDHGYGFQVLCRRGCGHRCSGGRTGRQTGLHEYHQSAGVGNHEYIVRPRTVPGRHA